MVDFGERLKALRLERGLTQQQVADRIWVSKAMVSSYELSNRYPSYDVLAKIAKLFNVSTDYLLGLEKYSPEKKTIDISGLTEKQVKLMQKLIEEFRNSTNHQ